MRLLLFLLFFMQLHVAGFAQKPPHAVKAAPEVKIDSSVIKLRHLDSAAVAAYKNKRAFNYTENPNGKTWIAKIIYWISDFFDKIFNSKAFNNRYFGIFLKGLIYLLLVVLLVFIISKLSGIDLKILAKKSTDIRVAYTESLENIHEINFDEQIENALKAGNYRLVVRLSYLKTLKILSDRAEIFWMPDKTNQAYLAELKNEQQRQAFAQLTYQFEYVWYGDFPIDKSSFESINQSFQQFNQKWV